MTLGECWLGCITSLISILLKKHGFAVEFEKGLAQAESLRFFAVRTHPEENQYVKKTVCLARPRPFYPIFTNLNYFQKPASAGLMSQTITFADATHLMFWREMAVAQKMDKFLNKVYVKFDRTELTFILCRPPFHLSLS